MVSSPSTSDTCLDSGLETRNDDDLTIEVLDSLADVRAFRDSHVGSTIFDGDRGQDLRWLEAVCGGLRHDPYLLVAKQTDVIVGMLPLAAVKSWLFGRFLVSLPYVNTAGVNAADDRVASRLIDRAVDLADKLNVRHLELRHESNFEHEKLGSSLSSKVHMRLSLPTTCDALWDQFKSKVRNKVKKGDKQGFEIQWGSDELLPGFYEVFSHTMRDLGTPVFGRDLFRQILSVFAGSAELCVVRAADKAIAAALLVHGNGSTLVPSAASLHAYNSTNVNDWMYWQLLRRTIERGQRVFDFGRCTPEGNTFTFKKKWGAEPEPAIWQYYVREGSVADVRLEGGKYDRAVKIWQKLPLAVTRMIGPTIVRGIP